MKSDPVMTVCGLPLLWFAVLVVPFLMFSERSLCRQFTRAPSVVVRAQSKPDKEWKEYLTQSLRDLSGFSTKEIDYKVDEYGGCAERKHAAKGYFAVEKIGDRWWMIDPAGNLYYNKAVVSVNIGKSGRSADLAKTVFGGKQEWANATTQLLRDNGFNAMGAWSDELIMKEARPRLPYTVVWNFMSGYGSRRGGTVQEAGHTGYPEDCIFVFDPEFEEFCNDRAGKLSATKEDPYLIGHFSDNELPFPEDALDRFLQLSKREAGYKAAEQWLKERKGGSADPLSITPEDKAAFLELVADRYFSITSRAIKKYDPNHLFLGSRFHGKTLRQKPVFTAAGRYIDVVSINYYNTWTPDSARMQEWVDWAGKPILITEWYVKGADAGLPNESGAGWIVPTQNDRGLFYQHFALNLVKFKGCVGWHWFKYLDNDPQATDVDPSNKDANKGILTIHFEPYAPLLDKMKELNTRVYSLIEYFDGQKK